MARPHNEGAAGASRRRTQQAAFLAGRTPQTLLVGAPAPLAGAYPFPRRMKSYPKPTRVIRIPPPMRPGEPCTTSGGDTFGSPAEKDTTGSITDRPPGAAVNRADLRGTRTHARLGFRKLRG